MPGSPTHLLALTLAPLFAAVSWAQVSPPPEERPTTAPLVFLDGSPYLELDLGGKRGWFLLDTGANVSGVDQAWLKGARHRLDGETVVGGTTGGLRVKRARFERLDLGRSFFRDVRFTVQDYSGFKQPAGRRQAGLLGSDFLNLLQVTIDNERALADFRLRHERGERAAGMRAASLQWVNRLPVATLRVGGLDLPCRIDSGSSATDRAPSLDVNRAFVRALVASGVKLRETGARTVRGVAGAARRPLMKGAERPLVLRWGPLTLEGVTLVVHDAGSLAIDNPVGLVGCSVLARLPRYTIDPFDRLIWLPARLRELPARD